MAKITNSEKFDEIVEWAIGTLPQDVIELRDFPGIQVLDEPPQNSEKKRHHGRETLGRFSGIPRTQQRHDDVSMAPNLIFLFRGPIERCSRGDLKAEVKEVVWHEIAHWLGHSEHEIGELGLSTLSMPIRDGAPGCIENRLNDPDAEKAKTDVRLPNDCVKLNEVETQPLRCLKCYSDEIVCCELNKFIKHEGAWLGELVPVRAKICTCRSCGYEWDDEDNM